MVATPSPEETERRQHASAIDALCRDLGAPREQVSTLYESVLAQVADRVRVKDYLSIFVSRRVKRVLREGSAPESCEPEDVLR